MKKELLYTWDVSSLGMQAGGVVAQGYRAGNMVFMGGQTGFDLDGKFTGAGDAAAQTRQAVENIGRLMEMAGGSKNDVVKRILYVTEHAYREQAYPVYDKFFDDPKPGGTGLVISGLAT